MNCHTLADATPILKAIKEKTGTAVLPRDQGRRFSDPLCV